MSRIRLKYVQAWVDGEGRVHRYFRRRGYPRVPLPGLPGSIEFMTAYQVALAGPRTAIGAGRVKPGGVSAVVAEYFRFATVLRVQERGHATHAAGHS